MAVGTRAAPKGSAAVLAAALTEFASVFARPDAGAAYQAPAARRRRYRPVPLYNLVPAQLLGPYRRVAEVAGAPGGWRYLLRAGGQEWYADLRCADDRLTLNQVVGGEPAARFAAAYGRAAAEAPPGSDLRVLRMPSTRFQALWLAGTSDFFIDLAFAEEPFLSGPELLQTAFR